MLQSTYFVNIRQRLLWYHRRLQETEVENYFECTIKYQKIKNKNKNKIIASSQFNARVKTKILMDVGKT